ncbi:Uncharacterised protein [Mycobacterium tuberculosis]|nr:Uncharacterised protein [Mycobacterium tuberculosis]
MPPASTPRTSATGTFSSDHSRSRHVAGSPSTQVNRLIGPDAPAGSGRYGSGIGTPCLSAARVRCRFATARIASSTGGASTIPTPSGMKAIDSTARMNSGRFAA